MKKVIRDIKGVKGPLMKEEEREREKERESYVGTIAFGKSGVGLLLIKREQEYIIGGR